MTSWEIRRPNGKIERFTTAELRARCLAGSVTRETPTRREGAPEWEWAIDVPGMSDVFALPRVHRLIPSLLLPLAAVLIVASYLVDASPMGSHPKGGAGDGRRPVLRRRRGRHGRARRTLRRVHDPPSGHRAAVPVRPRRRRVTAKV